MQYEEILRSILDVALVSFIVYRALLIIRGTRAAPVLGGLTLLVVLYFLSRPFGLVTLSWILNNFLSQIILVVVVIFQDEIRRGLTKAVLQPIFGKASKPLVEKTIEEIAIACARLAHDRTGALIVIQRDVGLDEIVEEGELVDSEVSRKVIQSIFLKDSPLHDGAMVIEGTRIKAAGCVLPLSFNPDLDPALGTRHRAALGLSEKSDAIILVVSEENGAISLVREGRITRNLGPAELRDALFRLVALGGQLEEEENVE